MSADGGYVRWMPTAIMGVTATLMMFGVVMIASAGASLDRSLLSVTLWKSSFGRQLAFVVLGFVAMLVFARIGCKPFAWRLGSWWQPTVLLVILACACLVATLIPGVGIERNGARRWLAIGPLVFQPSELAKVALVVFLSAFLAARGEQVKSTLKTLLPAVLVIGALTALVGWADFGTAALLGLVGGVILLTAGCRVVYLMLAALPGLALGGYLIYCEPYRVRRLISFLDIWADPQGASYHPIQSLATIVSGGWFGRGLGAGIQKYGYLPASQTDFIFSVLCEETGLFGGLTVILLFMVLLVLGLRAMRAADTSQARLLAFGVTLLICLQAVINIAVVTVMAPTKGIALPFVSAGGSGVICLGALVGLLAGVARRGRGAEPLPVAVGNHDLRAI
ncbi:MAG: cell division protein FtsW, partial [Phycisphaerae bacterium]|nr:cell division protein FtsW [Phycisphaerae bacterium]